MIIYIKMDLALNNLERLICHKTQPTNLPSKSSRLKEPCVQSQVMCSKFTIKNNSYNKLIYIKQYDANL